MGIFGKSAPYQVILEPFDPLIGFNASFCSPNIETLHMKEKFSSFKDVDIAIKNEAGQQVLTCHCKGGSFTNKKEFRDAQGTPLFTVRAMPASQVKQGFEAMDGTHLCTALKKFSMSAFRMTISLQNLVAAASNAQSSEHSGELELECKGNWSGTSATIAVAGTDKVLGHITESMRDPDGGKYDGKRTYTVAIAPGVDYAFMAALCICFDEAYHESTK
ncbi:uncharacterized protein STEHIDRAFT_126426 [Stereum hirsutum FP-91666 SS1]|uniref:DUF567-domain-containing protein n=1 Tax=Stereum hirsutum (strain FP-91666) TaxID=721885 RepID=R7RZ16_STEHR|nr:uncharacterized protein STEHIDRAFT_126426 [Stereum hirsutum FP-91666 SS1]EIM79552.1 hypothetical protein STEHIDRAFT_126426 [Stereum hirsutum FP-91666 SS1]